MCCIRRRIREVSRHVHADVVRRAIFCGPIADNSVASFGGDPIVSALRIGKTGTNLRIQIHGAGERGQVQVTTLPPQTERGNALFTTHPLDGFETKLACPILLEVANDICDTSHG